jgi:SAM-dependent methyltransferase
MSSQPLVLPASSRLASGTRHAPAATLAEIRPPASLAHGAEPHVDSKEFALACGFVLGWHFFGWEDLHYGFWQPGAVVDVHHLSEAQARFSEFLLSHIPVGTNTILDVGCGTGSVARRLIERGHRVDCVSPGPFLTPVAQERLGDTAGFFHCRFEELETASRYDVVLFCESLQYVDLQKSLRRAVALLNPGGYLVIADFFRTGAKGRSPMAGGHLLTEFYREIAGLPLAGLRDVDITRETAPTVKLINDAMTEAVRPMWEMTQHFLRANRPWLSRILHWTLRRRLAKLEQKQFAGSNTPEAFAMFKSYRLLVYQARTAHAAGSVI